MAQYLIMATGLYVQCPIDRAFIDRASDLLNPYMQCPIDRAAHTQSLINPYMVGRWTSNLAAWFDSPLLLQPGPVILTPIDSIID